MRFPEAAVHCEEYAWIVYNTRWVVVLGGLPGSGKTTFARQLVQAADAYGITAKIISADDYFYCPRGDYLFDRRYLPDAHEYCRIAFDRIIDLDDRKDPENADIIIIDNASIRDFEYEHYKRRALERQEEFTTFVMRCDSKTEALARTSKPYRC